MYQSGQNLDFQLSATPLLVTVFRGQTITYRVDVTSVGNFSSTVTVHIAGGLPPGTQGSITPSSVAPAAGRPAVAVLTVATTAGTPTGTYNITITGSSTGPYIVHSIIVTLTVVPSTGDFILSTSQEGSPLIVGQGQCRNVTVSVVALASFNSNVSLFSSLSSPSLTAEFSPNIVTPPLGGRADSNLQICVGPQAYLGKYNLTIIAFANTQGGTDSHWVTIVLIVSGTQPQPQYEFVISVSPPVVTVPQGSSGTATIWIQTPPSMTSSQTVNLASAGLPQGMNLIFSPNPVTVQPIQTTSSTIMITVDRTVPVGHYTITVTVGFESLNVIHSAPFLVQVTSPSATSSWTISVATDKQSYNPTDHVHVTGRVTTNGSPPTCQTNSTCYFSFLVPVTVKIMDQKGGQIYSTEFDIDMGNIFPSSWPSKDFQTDYAPTSPMPPGQYTVTAELSNSACNTTSNTISCSPIQATTSFEVAGSSTSPRCVIATAAFGSELAGPVLFLRSFRDRDVNATLLGSSFMSAFNSWYYSWAPTIAQQIAPNEKYKAATRVLISPLIGSLYVSHMVFTIVAPASPELAVLLAGLLASVILGLIYLTPFYGLVWKLSRRRITKRTIYKLLLVAAALTFLATLTTGTFSAAANLTALAVVETLLLTPALVLRKMASLTKNSTTA